MLSDTAWEGSTLISKVMHVRRRCFGHMARTRTDCREFSPTSLLKLQHLKFTGDWSEGDTYLVFASNFPLPSLLSITNAVWIPNLAYVPNLRTLVLRGCRLTERLLKANKRDLKHLEVLQMLNVCSMPHDQLPELWKT